MSSANLQGTEARRISIDYQALYTEVWSAYKGAYGAKSSIPPHVWAFFHELHLLQTAKDKAEITNVCWAIGVFVGAAKSTSEDRRSLEVAKTVIKVLPAKEHEAWYTLCQTDHRVQMALASHPDSQSLKRDHESAAKSAVAVAMILMDFQYRWQTLEPWQRDFMSSTMIPGSATALREAQQIVDILNPDTFTFLFAKQLIRAGKCNSALKLIIESPPEKLSGVVEFGDPLRKHSYFELYVRFLKGEVEKAGGFLKHLVTVEAYSDESLMVFLQNEELKDAVFFVLQFVSLARRVYTGNSRSKSRSASRSASSHGIFRNIFCCNSSKASQPFAPTMLVRISNIPHVLLRGLLLKYEGLDESAREQLLHDRDFLQAVEVVLLLNESEVMLRGVERLSESRVDSLRKSLTVWARFHWLRILAQNRTDYNAGTQRVQRLVSKQELWTWASSEERNSYFKSDKRSSEDIASVLWRFFEVSMFLDPTIIRQLVTDAQHRRPPLDIMETFLPVNSRLFDVVAAEVSKRSTTLVPPEVKLLMRSRGFYDVGIQGFLKEGELERTRAVFHEKMAFARLMQVVSRLFTFRDGQMDRYALESSLGQISTACNGDNTCLRLMGEVLDAALRKQDQDFLADGSGDIDSDPSAFTVAGLASCARRLRVACDTVKNQPVQMTFGKVVGAFLETPPRGWVPLFNSLETVLFFLRFMEKEDLDLAYQQFDAENAEAFKSDASLLKLLDEAKEYYKVPFINLQNDVTDLCNLDIRGKLARAKHTSQRRPVRERPGDEAFFGSNDWNLLIDIAACAAESMKEKYNVPMLPHHTQMIALLMFSIQVCQGPGKISVPRTILGRVGTGEGKSWIIGMLAAFVAKKGLIAHVVIDNQTLLERDFAIMAALFKKMNISAEKGQLGKSSQVVYCSAMDIELHFMDKMKAGVTDVNFKKCVMIVDEVDSLIVDENVYQCYVDDDQSGSEICEWWWVSGRNENKYNFESWKRKIMEKMEAAEMDSRIKVEGKHYCVDDNGMMWALDERTSTVKRSAWFLWLEVMRRERFDDYRIRYCSRQSVICQKSCFSSYSFIFGLTGSLGTEAEQAYTKNHFNASCFYVPPFLDTCRGTSRPRPKCIGTYVGEDERRQLAQTVNVVTRNVSQVPILVVCKDAERLKKVALGLKELLPDHLAGDKLGPGVIELLDRPGKETEFQQMVEVATQALQGQSGAKTWRVTVTTAVGARGQDYHISDELVDEKGGFLLILEYVPDSQREWIQFLGRTARHDHPGQYAVVLCADDYSHIPGLSTAQESTLVTQVLDSMNDVNERRMADAQLHLERGVLMHKYTGQFWAWFKRNQKNSEDVLDKFGQWVDLCDSFSNLTVEEIKGTWEVIGLPEMKSLADPDPFQMSGIGGGGAGANMPVGKSTVFDGDRRMQGKWEDSYNNGMGRMVWPNGQFFEGAKLQADFVSQFRHPL
jgi:hypothetical protein